MGANQYTYAPPNVRFVGLRNWMDDNHINVKELAELCDMSYNGMLYNISTAPWFAGKKRKMRKFTRDAILRVTGLTYEECFNEDGG